MTEQATAAHVVEIAERWLHAQAPHLQDVVRCPKVQDGVLFVSCHHSAAAQECRELLAQLKKTLSERFGEQAPQIVRIVRQMPKEST